MYINKYICIMHVYIYIFTIGGAFQVNAEIMNIYKILTGFVI